MIVNEELSITLDESKKEDIEDIEFFKLAFKVRERCPLVMAGRRVAFFKVIGIKTEQNSINNKTFITFNLRQEV